MKRAEQRLRKIRELEWKLYCTRRECDRWYKAAKAAHVSLRNIRANLAAVDRRLTNGKQRDR